MLTTIFFDLDETLMDFKKAEAMALQGTLLRLGLTPSEQITARYSAINRSQWERLERGEINREQVQLGRFELLFAELGVDCSSREAQSIYVRLLGQGHDLIPGARELLEDLQPRYRLYLVSNGTASVQDSRLRDSGLGAYFRQVFISERVGCDKPSRAFFEACFAEIPDFSRQKALIVGDSLTSDIQGGRNAGIRTCWFNPQGRIADIVPDCEIRALAELPALLERM